jgi:hypothetical protein
MPDNVSNSYAIMRIDKLTSWSQVNAADKEHHRTLEKPQVNVDHERSSKNEDWSPEAMKGKSYADRIKGRIGDQTIRKNAVLGLEVLMTYSPEMEGKVSKTDWMMSNLKWLVAEFGNDNVVSVVEHRDETTTHLQAVVVPLDKKGKLSADRVLGKRADMRNRQTRYAEAMAPHDLTRGITDSDAKWIPLKELRKEDVRQAAKTRDALKLLTEEIPLPEFTPQYVGESDREYQARQKKQIDDAMAIYRKNIKDASDTLLKLAQGSLRHLAAQKRVKALENQIASKEADLEKTKKELEDARAEIARLTGNGNNGKTVAEDLKTIRILPKPSRGQMEVA